MTARMLDMWSPMLGFTGMHSPDRIFHERLGTLTRPLPVNVTEEDGAYRVAAALPGFRPEEVEVTVDDGTLSIKAHRGAERSAEKGGYIRREVAFGDYVRNLRLPADTMAQEITASFENGVLTLRLPRAARPEPIKVAIGPAPTDEGTSEPGTAA
jgi:HSP20 family protein